MGEQGYEDVKERCREEGMGRVDKEEFDATFVEGSPHTEDDDEYDEVDEATAEFVSPNDHVVMNTSIDVSDATEEERALYEQMAEIYEQQFRTFVEKNMDYSSSFLTSGKVEQQYDGGPFDSALHANLYGVWKRQQDKDQRFYERAFNGTDTVDEPLTETTADAMNYWAILTWLARHGGDE
jgi:hypothetical protein